MGVYLRPRDLDQALDALAAQPLAVIAGGTYFYPARVGAALDDDLLDITAIAGLDAISEAEGHHRIGALVTWSDLVAADLPAHFDGLRAAARAVGGQQVQNMGTLCGNVCNASPAADGMPNLLALEAEVELASRRGRRRLPIADFVTGNRATNHAPDELMTAILVPKPRDAARATFVKLGARRYLVISIVMVGAVIEAGDDGRVTAARVAVGACSAVARRLPGLEAALIGRPLDGALAEAVLPSHLDVLTPIDDVRGSAAYRQDATVTVLRRALTDLGDRS